MLDWVTSIAFSPDGTQVLAGSWDNTFKLWDAVSRKLDAAPSEFGIDLDEAMKALAPKGGGDCS